MTAGLPTTCWGTIGPGQTLLADAAYDSNRLRDHLAAVGAKAVIQANPVQVRPASARPAGLPASQPGSSASSQSSKPLQGNRHKIREDDANFLALIKMAATRIWLRVYESVS